MTPCWKWKRKHKKKNITMTLTSVLNGVSFFIWEEVFLLFWNFNLFLDGFDNLKLRCINQLDLLLVIEVVVFSDLIFS